MLVVLEGDPGNIEASIAVEMATLCRGLNVLPYAGGLYEQPWIVVELMKIAIEMQNVKDKRDRERSKGGTKHA